MFHCMLWVTFAAYYLFQCSLFFLSLLLSVRSWSWARRW